MGNLQVRFLEGWAPAMAPGYSTVIQTNPVDKYPEVGISSGNQALTRCAYEFGKHWSLSALA